LSFLLAARLWYFRCVWPELTISVISGTRHTVFSQHSRTTTFTAKLAFLTDVAGLPSYCNTLYAPLFSSVSWARSHTVLLWCHKRL